MQAEKAAFQSSDVSSTKKKPANAEKSSEVLSLKRGVTVLIADGAPQPMKQPAIWNSEALADEVFGDDAD
eukprot:4386211-Karenia_brevis.AAC.1